AAGSVQRCPTLRTAGLPALHSRVSPARHLLTAAPATLFLLQDCAPCPKTAVPRPGGSGGRTVPAGGPGRAAPLSAAAPWCNRLSAPPFPASGRRPRHNAAGRA